MKNISRMGVLIVALSLGTQAFALQTHEQLMHNREQAISDWNRVLSILKKAGVKEDDPAYKRVHRALKANETHLKTLQGSSYHGKAGKVAATAAGAGLLSKLGGLFQTESQAPHAEPVKVGSSKRAHTASVEGTRPTKRKKTQHSYPKHPVKAPAKK